MIRSVQKAVQVDMAKCVAQNPQALLRKDEGTKVQNYEMLKQSLEGEIDANNKDLDEQTNMKSEAEEQKSTDEGVRTFKLQRLSAARASVLSSYKKRRKACEQDCSLDKLAQNCLDKLAGLDDRIASLQSTGGDDDADDDGYDDEGRCRHMKLSSELEPRFVENAARLAAKVRHKAKYRKNRDERRKEFVGENAMPATSVRRERRLQGTHVLGPEGWVMNDKRDSECLHMYF